MALGDTTVASLFPQSPSAVSNHLDEFSANGNHVEVDGERSVYSSKSINDNSNADFFEVANSNYTEMTTATSMVYLPQTVVLCELRHEYFREILPSDRSKSGLAFQLRRRLPERLKTGCVALVLCLKIGVTPPDVIKIFPCAQMECWIDPFTMAPQKALETIGRSLNQQYEKWQPEACFKVSLDPTVDEVKRLCITCRKYAKSERVLFHYNGHGVPKPTPSGDIWLFNESYTQYKSLPLRELDSWLNTPSIYVFDCSAAGLIISSFVQLLDCSSSSSVPTTKDCILLGACEAHETLPQSVEFPADVFTSCLTTPIKVALRWLSSHSLLSESFNYLLIDRIPGRQTDRKTLLGELNWIFTAVTDSIAWNVLPHDLFQRLFRQDLLVASLFRNFLLAERILRLANCSPISYPMLPPTHQHHMWDAWDMAAEICLSQLPTLLEDPNVALQPSSFFTEQLTAFELWIDHGSEDTKPPEQLPIVLQVLYSQCHRFRALVLLGRFLDLGPWAVGQALSVGIFPVILKLLQTTTPGLRQILVFIWTKILALDKVDLVKDGGHMYFIRFLDCAEIYPEQRAMAAFILAVIVDDHRLGQRACIDAGLIPVCLKNLRVSSSNETQTEPLFLQWICLCLGKLWEDFMEAQLIGLQADGPAILSPLLSEPQPEVRAAAVFALGTVLDVRFDATKDDLGDEDCCNEKIRAEVVIIKSLLDVVSDGSPLVRAEVAAALSRFAFGHIKHLKSVAASYWKPASSPSFVVKGSTTPTHYIPQGSIVPSIASLSLTGNDGQTIACDVSVSTSSPLASPGTIHGSPLSNISSQHSDSGALNDSFSNGVVNHARLRPLDNSLCLQCLLAMFSLVKDPSPHVARLGRRVLSIIGIEQVFANSLNVAAHPGESSTVSTSLGGLAHSSSWFELNGGGRMSLSFRTPPVSPTRPSYMTGIRRVSSVDFRPHLLNSPDSGLADPLLGSAGPSGVSDHSFLPWSTIYNWSCGHFSKPLHTAVDDTEGIIASREEKEKQAWDHIVKCQRSSMSKLHYQIASWDTKFESGTKAAVLQPFSPVIIASDKNERIRVWNYEEATLLNSFKNHEHPESKGVSKLCLVNEFDESLLLVASNDGNIRIWKDYTSKGQQKLVTAFPSIQGHRPGVGSVNAVVDWQQQSGYLFVSGEVSSIMAWDLEKEQLVSTIPAASDSSISALAASQVHRGQFAAGFMDGYVRLYDIRTPEMMVSETQPDTERVGRVLGIGFQPGLEPAKIVSASEAGNIQILDMRHANDEYITINAHRGSLTLAVHRHAPIIASGSAKQFIKTFNLSGDPLGTIRYYPTFMAQKIEPVNCLTFHPYQVLLAVGSADACVSIYADEVSPPR